MIDDFKSNTVNIYLELTEEEELSLYRESFFEEIKKETEFQDAEYLEMIQEEILSGRKIEKQQKLDKLVNLKNKNRLYKLLFKMLGPESSLEIMEDVQNLNLEDLVKFLRYKEHEINTENIQKVKKQIEKDLKDKGIEVPPPKPKIEQKPAFMQIKQKSPVYNFMLQKKSQIFASNYHIGIDIGESNIKFIQLRKKDDKIIIDNYKKIPFEKDKKVKDLQKITAALQKNIDFNLIKISHVGITYSNLKSHFNILDFPGMDEKELKTAIEFKLNKEKPEDIENISFQYEIMHSEDNKVDVFSITCDENEILSIANIIKGLAILPEKLSLKEFSLINALKFLYDEEINKSILILDIGLNKTTAIYSEHGIPKLVKKIDVGGRTFTGALEDGLTTEKGIVKLDANDAEKLKIDHGITYSSSYGFTEFGLPISQIGNALKNPLDKLIDETEIVMENIKSRFNKEVKQIYLTGGGAKLKNIDEYIEDRIRKKVLIPSTGNNIIAGIEIADTDEMDDDFISFLNAMGCAINPPNYYNFIPTEFKDKKIAAKVNYIGSSAILIIMILLVLASSSMISKKNRTAAKFHDLQNNYAHIKDRNATVVDMINKRNELNTLKSEIKNKIISISNKINTTDLLKIFSTYTPENVSLSSLKFETEDISEDNTTGSKEKIVLTCKVIDSGKEEELLITEFINRINNLNIFQKPVVSEKMEGAEKIFTVELKF